MINMKSLKELKPNKQFASSTEKEFVTPLGAHLSLVCLAATDYAADCPKPPPPLLLAS